MNTKKKLKIVCTHWQIMHWWDLFNALKEHADFYLITNNHRDWRKPQYLAARSIPDNVYFVPYYEKGKYDFAILNIDQQCSNPRLGKTRLFIELNELIQDIPKVIINHATPVYPELLAKAGETYLEAEKECRKIIKGMVGDTLMVTNSYQAATEAEWGWGYPIWHGLNADEWLDLPKEPRIFSALSPGGCDEYYNRSMMNEVIRQMSEKWGHTIYWAKINVGTQRSITDYKEYLGKSLIYLDVSFRTPMNRARAEAMLSGCCVVQVDGGHDLKRFARNGENMILVNNKPEQIVQTLIELVEKRYKKCVKIGQAGKETAKKYFNRERYRDDWLKLIKEKIL